MWKSWGRKVCFLHGAMRTVLLPLLWSAERVPDSHQDCHIYFTSFLGRSVPYHCCTACATVSITGNIAKYLPKRAKSTGANLQVKEKVAFLLTDCCSWEFQSMFFLLIPNFRLFREKPLDSVEWVGILPLLAQYFQLFASLARSFSLYYSGKCQKAVLACVQQIMHVESTSNKLMMHFWEDTIFWTFIFSDWLLSADFRSLCSQPPTPTIII